jgi:hypothetical protein
MKIILFDLGDTLEHVIRGKDVLVPSALELLSAVQNMKDRDGHIPGLALVSDFDKESQEYYALLQALDIDNFFKPFKERITLSKKVGEVCLK